MSGNNAAYTEEQDRAFRRSLGQFATGVTIITTRWKDEALGLTANSFSSLSLNPRLVLWSIRKQSNKCEAFCESSHFTVNVLSADQTELSQKFASSRPTAFDPAVWREGAGSVPVLKDALASFECRLTETRDGGDHILLIGEVVAFTMQEKRPLLFVQGRYAEAGELPLAADNSVSSGSRDDRNASSSPTLLSLLNQAQQVQADKFAKVRAEHCVNFAESRVLAVMELYPDASIDALVQRSHMAQPDLEDTVKTLVERGLIAKAAHGFQLTEAGMRKRIAIGKSWRVFQDAELSGIAATEIVATRYVLSRLAGR